nr:PREDICTED: putative inorganic phosphate cotransporter isoform X2 [Bemisia tabaci]
MVAAFAMRSCFNIAIVQMVRPVLQKTAQNTSKIDMTCPMPDQGNITFVPTAKFFQEYFNWNERTQGIILSSFYPGYILTQLPGSILAQRFGGKHTLGIGLLVTSVLTLAIPWAAKQGPNYLIAVRFIQGVGEGAKFPCICHLLAQWAPPLERSKMTTFVFSGCLIGLLVGTSLGGIIIDVSGHWQNVFFIFGILGIGWYILWAFFTYENPSSHPFISDEEKQYLLDTIGQLERKKTLGPIPWREMMKSKPLWSLIIAEFGHSWAVFVILSDLPKYMNDVIHFTIAENGLLSAVPNLTAWAVSIISSYLADWILKRKYMSMNTQRKVFAIIGCWGPALGLIMVSYAGCDKHLVIVTITVGLALMGFEFPSLKTNTIDLSPNYTATIMAFANGIGCFAGVFAPYTIGVLTPDRTIDEWRIAFWIMAGIMISTNCAFLLYGSAEVQYWNDMDEHTAKLRNEETRTEPGS